MKCLKIVFLIALVTIGFISCRKDKVSVDMSGTWEGNWGFGIEAPSNYEKWVMDKSGNLFAYDADGYLYASGSWEMDGHDFEAQYTPVGATYSYTFSGFEEGADVILGTWGETPSAIDGGTFEMYRN